MDFCLIFVSFGHYDEPEILRYEKRLFCPKDVDVRQFGKQTSLSALRIWTKGINHVEMAYLDPRPTFCWLADHLPHTTRISYCLGDSKCHQ